MKLSINDITISCKSDLLHMQIKKGNTIWENTNQMPYMLHDTFGKLYLKDAGKKQCSYVKTAIAKGICMQLEAFKDSKIVIVLHAMIEEASSDVYMSVTVTQEDEQISAIYWPSAFAFQEKKKSWYTLIPFQQGLLIPNDWPTEVKKLPFDGQFCTSSAYMPWFAQIKDQSGYIAIALQPWDGGYQIEHPANGPYTNVSVRWLRSLKEMRYKRTLRYTFLDHADHTAICKVYQAYVKEKGIYSTLKEKAIQNHNVDQLIGCMFVHTGIKTNVSEESMFYNHKQSDKNQQITTFDTRISQIQSYHDAGVKKLYMHLDGWAQPGYDNNHPDYYTVCEEAGGALKLRRLGSIMHKYGYLLGLHDQYRDFYHQANSYHDQMAVHDIQEKIPSHHHWAGGNQSYLCNELALYFLKRNLHELNQQNIAFDASYLDVFTCNEPDECHHPMHRVTRKESLDYREHCFAYLNYHKLLPSSRRAK